MRHCTKCNTTKPLSDFKKNKTKPSGYQSSCFACHQVYQAKWYQENKEVHGERTYERNRRIDQEHRQRIIDYLKEHPCVDCGESDPIVLEFDHVRGEKKNEISKMIRNAWKRTLEEISKCDVRCANCHRRRTAKQFNWYARINL
jgi:hypothetical protein